jgi:hypothetical protein
MFKHTMLIESRHGFSECLSLSHAINDNVLGICLADLASSHAATRRGIKPRRSRYDFFEKLFTVGSG